MLLKINDYTHLKYKIDDISIKIVFVFNFIGIIMDEHLNWKSHVETISNKCSNTIGELNKPKRVFTAKQLNSCYITL